MCVGLPGGRRHGDVQGAGAARTLQGPQTAGGPLRPRLVAALVPPGGQVPAPEQRTARGTRAGHGGETRRRPGRPTATPPLRLTWFPRQVRGRRLDRLTSSAVDGHVHGAFLAARG